MLPIAGQTTGPIGLKFAVDTHVWSGKAEKNLNFFKIFIFIFPWATPGPTTGIKILKYFDYLKIVRRRHLTYCHPTHSAGVTINNINNNKNDNDNDNNKNDNTSFLSFMQVLVNLRIKNIK